MAYYYPEPSHTFNEYLLVPGFSSGECIPSASFSRRYMARGMMLFAS